MISRSDLIREAKQELVMRRKVWKRVTSSEDRFIDPVHQLRYDKMKLTEDILTAMTDAEFHKILARINQEDGQKSLF